MEGKVLGVAGPALQAVEVEKDVVEDGEFVRDREAAVADLLMELLQGIFARRRIRLGYKTGRGQWRATCSRCARRLTAGDAEGPQDAIDEQGAIELLPHNLDVLDELGVYVG